MPSARGIVVIASSGRELWARVRARAARRPHPLDDYVSLCLMAADGALQGAGISFRRFEARLGAEPSLDFRALGEMVGLGSMGPFGMLIHEQHGPWWALRGAYLVDRAVAPPLAHRPPCAGCHAPCLGSGRPVEAGIALATPEVRGRCVVGQASRYTDEQIAHHYPPPGR
jgi:hypothetical protein